jgi:hypothetical protein
MAVVLGDPTRSDYFATHIHLLVKSATKRYPYRLEQHALSYMPSGYDLLWTPSGVASMLDLWLVADPAYDAPDMLSTTAPSADIIWAPDVVARFTALPGTAEEAWRILMDREATELDVRTTISPRILHLVTHGFFGRTKKSGGPPVCPRTRASRACSNSLLLPPNALARRGIHDAQYGAFWPDLG